MKTILIAIIAIVAAILLSFVLKAEGQPSIFDAALATVSAIGPWFTLPIAAIAIYTCVYKIELRIAAAQDSRNDRKRETWRYENVIFWERLRRFDLRTLIYVVSIPMLPILGLIALFSLFEPR